MRMYARMHAYMHAHMHACAQASKRAHAQAGVCVLTHTHASTHASVPVMEGGGGGGKSQKGLGGSQNWFKDLGGSDWLRARRAALGNQFSPEIMPIFD